MLYRRCVNRSLRERASYCDLIRLLWWLGANREVFVIKHINYRNEPARQPSGVVHRFCSR